jgi:hypothetical protein
MADFVTQRDIGAIVRVGTTPTFSAITAGSNSGTAVTSAGVDRLDPSTGSLAGSCKFALAYSTVLGATHTLAIGAVVVNTAPDNATWSTFGTFTAPGTLATGPSGGGTLTGASALDIGDLEMASRYLQFVYTPTLSATSVDTAEIAAVTVLGGYDRLAV